ncbi:putative beta propeller protein [Trypanosoma rangeli]|uniref:Putative beta propeller protein n=1 Tax=Trypanosoma rangeli TaxID=5698 RepID=A0A422N5S6_TRYRA|nr:putative beta propeller protein [Trypanosoma rangeli]RNF00810.1 putative beta propeller protein [Trypanosoma rangeli]|eukprot:RNF00810.1 putative beta propeller protein [Trypanosoma rangeli]
MDHKLWSLPVKRVPAAEKLDRSVIWNNARLCYEQKLFGQVTCIRYNNAGTTVGCTSTNQLTLLRVPQTEGVITNEQREKKCFSLRFRDDDKMALFSFNQRVVVRSTQTAFERQFLGHFREVRDAIFLDRHNFVSGSDDTTVRLWDIMNENALLVSKTHTDYVRCLENYSSGCFFSGSYDHTINLWDTRLGFEHPVQSSERHIGSPIEAMLHTHTNLLACTAGDQVILFDMRKGLSTVFLQESHHTKTVVALAFSKGNNVLLTGSLDQRVKFFSLENGGLELLASKKYDAPVTAVAIHPSSSEFAVGTAGGDLRIMRLESALDQKREEEEEEGVLKEEGLEGKEENKRADFLTTKMHDVRQQLVSYQYNRALKTALYSRNPDVIVSTLEELVRRGALHVALSGQNDRTVVRILRFSVNHVDSPQFCESMMIVLDVIFEIYATCVGRSSFLHREIMIARRRLGAVLATLQRMEHTLSIMELIVNDV